jgi:hypothetical protein
MTTPGKYTYSRGTDGCDETFDIYDRNGEHMVSVHFWEAEEWAETTAKLIVTRLNSHEFLVTACKLALVALESVLLPTDPSPDEVRMALRGIIAEAEAA